MVSDRFFQSVAVFITVRRTTTAPERRRDARYEGEERIGVVTVESDSCEEVARSNEEKQAGQSPFLYADIIPAETSHWHQGCSTRYM